MGTLSEYNDTKFRYASEQKSETETKQPQLTKRLAFIPSGARDLRFLRTGSITFPEWQARPTGTCSVGLSAWHLRCHAIIINAAKTGKISKDEFYGSRIQQGSM
jgi:hypothetical protein